MRALIGIALLTLSLAGCGDAVKGVDEDAKAAKSEARDAVRAAEDAAKRVDELSRQPLTEPAAPPDKP